MMQMSAGLDYGSVSDGGLAVFPSPARLFSLKRLVSVYALGLSVRFEAP